MVYKLTIYGVQYNRRGLYKTEINIEYLSYLQNRLTDQYLKCFNAHLHEVKIYGRDWEVGTKPTLKYNNATLCCINLRFFYHEMPLWSG